MRRKHQQIFGRQNYIRDIPNSDPRAIKNKKVSTKFTAGNNVPKKATTGNVEATYHYTEVIKASIISRKISTILAAVGLLALIFAMVIVVHCMKLLEPADRNKNAILRHYTEVLSKLDDAPEDISASPYQSNVPKVIQKDIDKMLEMGEDACVIYYNDQKDQIVIEPSEESELGYKIRFKPEVDLYYSFTIEEPNSDISFYKSGETLVIYGREGYGRHMRCYTMNNEKIWYERLEEDAIDLYGTGVEFDQIRPFNRHCTLVRSGNEFALYRLGERLCSTVFEDGEIAEWNYYYLLTKGGSCYNVYYSTDEDDYWIKFSKIAENVDEILDEEVTIIDSNGYELSFPILKIGNKKYAQLPDATTERVYGQNYGGNHRNEEKEDVDFTSRLIEISAVNSSKVKLVYSSSSWHSSKYTWYLHYYFKSGDRECYIKQRINGLDENVSELIPQYKLEMFNEKEISVDEVEEYINQLRMLYDEYTDNTF